MNKTYLFYYTMTCNATNVAFCFSFDKNDVLSTCTLLFHINTLLIF